LFTPIVADRTKEFEAFLANNHNTAGKQFEIIDFDAVYQPALANTPILKLRESVTAIIQEVAIYHHVLFTEEVAILYLWDTRQVTAVIPADLLFKHIESFEYANDNRMPLVWLIDDNKHIDYMPSIYCEDINVKLQA
jgi:hypothetical protein